MKEIPKTSRTFIQMCEDLAAKRAAGRIPKEQIDAMDTFRKGLSVTYNSKTEEELDALRAQQDFRSGMKSDGDYFEKSTGTV